MDVSRRRKEDRPRKGSLLEEGEEFRKRKRFRIGVEEDLRNVRNTEGRFRKVLGNGIPKFLTRRVEPFGRGNLGNFPRNPRHPRGERVSVVFHRDSKTLIHKRRDKREGFVRRKEGDVSENP
jgi:hypothetical protein